MVAAALLLVVALSDATAEPHRKTTTRRARTTPTSVATPVTLEPRAPAPGVTLARGAVLVQTTLEMSLAADTAGVPASLAPDLSVGVVDDLTLSIVHSGSALTGFRGGAGAGFCFTGGAEGKCRTSYAGGGLEALYSLTRGRVAAGANAGLLITAVDPTRTDVKVGFKTKLTFAATSIAFNPSVWIALNDRHDPMLPHDDQLFLPLGVSQKLTKQLSLGVGSGVRAPLAHVAKRYAIPVGVVAQVALNPQVTLGSSLVFGRVVGGTEVMNPDPGLDARVLQMWLSVSSR